MEQKTILVVGGAGFIGSQINKMLYQAGYNTIVLDNLSTGERDAVIHGTFIEGDIADTELLNQIFKNYRIDAVMHFAAFINVGESVAEPSRYYQNNVIGSLNLLNAMIRHSVRTFIFSSTAAVYGIPKNDQSIQETALCQPINPYGETKLMVEKILRDYHNAYGLQFSCLRYFNAAGGDPEGEIKDHKPKESNLIPIVLRSLKTKDGKVTIFGNDYPTPDGTCIRDYVHIYDLGTAHISAMERLWNGGSSGIYNLGNGRGFSVKEVIKAAEQVTRLKVNVIEGNRRPGDPPCLLANSQRAREELNWKPIYPEIEKMIKHSWEAMSSFTNATII